MRPALATVLLVLFAACDERSPTSPTEPGFRIVGEVRIPMPASGSHFISGPSFVFLGASAEYRLSVQTGSDFSDRVLVAKASWTVDDSRIATVEPTGRLQTRAYGVTNLRAVFQDRAFLHRLQIAPDIGGTWQGTARLTNCQGRFCDPRKCRNVLFNPTSAITLRMVQQQTAVSGDVLAVPVNGHIRESGTIVGGGSRATGAEANLAISTIENFAANLQDGVLHGGFTSIRDVPGTYLTGSPCPTRELYIVEYEFADLRRTSR